VKLTVRRRTLNVVKLTVRGGKERRQMLFLTCHVQSQDRLEPMREATQRINKPRERESYLYWLKTNCVFVFRREILIGGLRVKSHIYHLNRVWALQLVLTETPLGMATSQSKDSAFCPLYGSKRNQWACSLNECKELILYLWVL